MSRSIQQPEYAIMACELPVGQRAKRRAQARLQEQRRRRDSAALIAYRARVGR